MARFRRSPQPQPRGNRIYSRTPVTTYYRSKAGDQTRSPFQKKEIPKNRRKLIAGAADIILVIILLIALIYSLVLNSSPRLTITDLSYRPVGDYQAAVQASLGSFKNRNKITFDEQTVANQLRSRFPEVQSVQTELPVFSEQANIKLIVSPPVLKLNGATGEFVVDSDGVAVIRPDSQKAFAVLPTVIDQSGFKAQAGRQVLSSDDVSFIENLIKQCHEAKVSIKSLTLPPLPQELDLRTADASYYVKFYLGGDVNNQVGQFLAARHQFAQTHQGPSQYLDVRVAGKVFYK